MDLFHTNMSILFIAFVVTATALESSQDLSDLLPRSLHATSRGKRTHNKDRKNIIDAGKKSRVDLEADDKKSCCLNGGICIMNTFCHCKRNFYGRFCEYRVHHRSCGSIRHGTWMASGCHLCHCFDGRMTCKVTTIHGCKKLSYVEGYDKNADYMVGMDKKAEDYDKFYDEFDYVPDTEVTSGTTSFRVPVWQLAMVTIYFTVYKSVGS